VFHAVQSAAADPALFHLEQVGEVCLHPDSQRARRGLPAQVAQRDVLAHAGADETLPLHQQCAVGQSGAWLRPTHEGRVVGLLGHHGEGLDGLVVEAELPGRQDPGVAEEQPVCGTRIHIAGLLAQAEG
jgi:hypothetical protein